MPGGSTPTPGEVPHTEMSLTIMWYRMEQQGKEIKELRANILEMEKKADQVRATEDATPKEEIVWQVESLNAKQRAKIWRTLEPKVEENVKEMVADKAIKEIAQTAVETHVQQQTQEVTKLTKELAQKAERENT